MKIPSRRQSLLFAVALAINLAAGAAYSGAPTTDASRPAAKEKGGINDPKGAGVVSSGVELPDTGDILICDDLRHRAIVVDRKTKQIIWQYGMTDKPGHAPG